MVPAACSSTSTGPRGGGEAGRPLVARIVHFEIVARPLVFRVSTGMRDNIGILFVDDRRSLGQYSPAMSEKPRQGDERADITPIRRGECRCPSSMISAPELSAKARCQTVAVDAG